MILSVGLDPRLTRTIILDELIQGEKNKSKSIMVVPENGGIDVSRVVMEFNEETEVIGILGGRNGELIGDFLDRRSIGNQFIVSQNESRTNIRIITEKGEETIIEGEAPRVSGLEIEKFYNLYNESISKADIICISGGLMRGMQEDVFEDLILLANNRGKKVLFSPPDEYYKPDLIRGLVLLNINLYDLEKLTGLLIESIEDMIVLGRSILENDIEILAIYKGEGSYVMLDKDSAYIIEWKTPLNLTEEGCREAFLAGYAVSDKRNYNFEYKIRISVACHIARGLEWNNGLFEMKNMKYIMNDLKISKIDSKA